MADPLPADRFLAALLAEGVRVQEHDGWRTHNRNHKGAWGPVHGVIVHHTVSSGSDATVRICRDGYSGLPGPLCQGVITKDGTFHLIGHGRCNHAGGGDPDVLKAVQDESYSERPPVPNVGNTDGIDGNASFYGWECENLGDGKDPWTAAQLDTIERASAAVCRAHGWSAKSVIGHKEWSDDKSDPTFAMPGMRQRITARLAGVSTSPPQQEDIVTPDDIQKIAAAAAAATWNYQLPNVQPDGTRDGTKKAAFWWLVWQDVFQAQLMAAISDAKMTPDEVREALADGTLQVQLTVKAA
ncbi:N-acetylmuramoyl-L-alanine amidase [Streptomyces sp. NPDC099050]|uniref:peptidoglycan recognition protein family protein n=1 Tax=Streptomyces sp. NPDC099050 TaxID=3366100 RepID=UPI003801A2FE